VAEIHGSDIDKNNLTIKADASRFDRLKNSFKSGVVSIL
jgi:hypothetical protein